MYFEGDWKRRSVTLFGLTIFGFQGSARGCLWEVRGTVEGRDAAGTTSRIRWRDTYIVAPVLLFCDVETRG